jgi:hypothetical protein
LVAALALACAMGLGYRRIWPGDDIAGRIRTIPIREEV